MIHRPSHHTRHRDLPLPRGEVLALVGLILYPLVTVLLASSIMIMFFLPLITAPTRSIDPAASKPPSSSTSNESTTPANSQKEKGGLQGHDATLQNEHSHEETFPRRDVINQERQGLNVAPSDRQHPPQDNQDSNTVDQS